MLKQVKKLACCFSGHPHRDPPQDEDQGNLDPHEPTSNDPSTSTSFSSAHPPAQLQATTRKGALLSSTSLTQCAAEHALGHGASTSMSGSSYTVEMPNSASSAAGLRYSDTSALTSIGHQMSSQHSSISDADTIGFLPSGAGGNRGEPVEAPAPAPPPEPAATSVAAAPPSGSHVMQRSTLQLPQVPPPAADVHSAPSSQVMLSSPANPSPASSEYAAMVHMALLNMRQPPDRPLSTIIEDLSSSNVSSKTSSMNHRSLNASRSHSHAGSSSSDRLYRTIQGVASEGDVLYSLNSTSSSIHTPPRASTQPSMGRPNSDTLFDTGSERSSSSSSEMRASSRSAPSLSLPRLMPPVPQVDSSDPFTASSSSKSTQASIQVEADSASMRSSVTFAAGLKEDSPSSPARGGPVQPTAGPSRLPGPVPLEVGSPIPVPAPFTVEVDLSARPTPAPAASRQAGSGQRHSFSAQDSPQLLTRPDLMSTSHGLMPDTTTPMFNMFKLLSQPADRITSSTHDPPTGVASSSSLPASASPSTQPAAERGLRQVQSLGADRPSLSLNRAQDALPSLFSNQPGSSSQRAPGSQLRMTSARQPYAHPTAVRSLQSGLGSRRASAGSGTHRSLGGTAAVQDLMNQFSSPSVAQAAQHATSQASGQPAPAAAGGSASTGALVTQAHRGAAQGAGGDAVAGPSRPASAGTLAGNDVRQQLLAVRQRTRSHSSSANTGKIMKLDIPSMEDI